MGLVDREQADIGAPKERERVGLGEALGRDIDQAKLAAGELSGNRRLSAKSLAELRLAAAIPWRVSCAT
jgi:hypothetical protein